MKVIFCTPCLTSPTGPYMDALEKSIALIKASGWDDGCVFEVGNPYISAARSIMTRKAMDAKPDVIVYLDYDLSWDPQDLLTLLETPGEVVAGTYRFKKEDEEYMGALLSNAQGTPLLREDGMIHADRVPAGFLKVTIGALEKFAKAYPLLVYGETFRPSIDLFNHGAHEGVWYGEDYAFSRNWVACGGKLWIIPNLNLTHHSADKAYPGNFHEFLQRQPGGAKEIK